MGKDWDKVVIPSSTWKECLRVLKPGAFAFIMSAPRQEVLGRMIYNLQEAGFETGFTSIYYCYATGFPKAINISKAIDKRKGLKRTGITRTDGKATNSGSGCYNCNIEGENSMSRVFEDGLPISDEAKTLDGFYGGFQPKPAVEIIIVVMKPLSEKSYIDQALKNGKGITNLDDCRIPYEKKYKPQTRGNLNSTSEERNYGYKDNVEIGSEKGRFPANLLVSDDILNDGKERTSNKSKDDKSASGGIWQKSTGKPAGQTYNDSGSFSRYFDLDAWAKENDISEDCNTFPFLICPKASKSEKNKGLDNLSIKQTTGGGGGIGDYLEDVNSASGKFGSEKAPSKNCHPTVKPIKLMSYLITLGSRKEDTVLDCFLGSGTTGVAAKLLGRKFIGIELSLDYLKIAQERIKNTKND